MDKEKRKTKMGDFWDKYEAKIILILGLILVAIISFEVGALKGSGLTQKPLIIEKPVETKNVATALPTQAQNSTPEALTDPISSTTPPANCAYVGSKNSTLYHLAASSYAKNIKAENRICFSSPDEAKSRGYVPDKSLSK